MTVGGRNESGQEATAEVEPVGDEEEIPFR